MVHFINAFATVCRRQSTDERNIGHDVRRSHLRRQPAICGNLGAEHLARCVFMHFLSAFRLSVGSKTRSRCRASWLNSPVQMIGISFPFAIDLRDVRATRHPMHMNIRTLFASPARCDICSNFMLPHFLLICNNVM